MADLGSMNGRKSVSHASSITNQAGVGPRKPNPGNPDFDFNLGFTKAKVLKTLDEKVPPNFRKFFSSPLYDRLLQTILLYFIALFQHEWIVKTMERSRKQHLEGYNPYAVAQRIRELDDELHHLRMELSPTYSEIIMKFSTYQKPQQDRMFFESLYETLINIVDEAFSIHKKRPEIEHEVGSLFRSKHFNMYQRKNTPPRSVDTLSVKELYSLKHETTNRALNAKMLSSLFEKPRCIGVQVASVTNTPLITQYIMSPIVARSMMKDSETRQSLFKSPQEKAERPHSVSALFKSAAMLRGVDLGRLQSEVGNLKMPADAQSTIGLIASDRAYKADRIRGPTGLIAPEATGLPVDDLYNHMALLKRYILYGPSMGMVPGVNPGSMSMSQAGLSMSQPGDFRAGHSVSGQPASAAQSVDGRPPALGQAAATGAAANNSSTLAAPGGMSIPA